MAMDTNDQNQPYPSTNRRYRSSFSHAIHSTIGKRKSFVRPPTPPPTYEERIHYPVFNPQDPRHNPASTPSSWHGSGYEVSQAPSPRESVSWMQSLPGRSLRKARSGFLALRSGMQRNQPSRSLHHRGNIPSIWSSSDSAGDSFDVHDDYFPSTISEASTEEDYNFGFGLYRTRCNCSSDLLGGSDGCRPRGPAITLAGPGRLPELHTRPYSSADTTSDERVLNSLDHGNASTHQTKDSSETRKGRWFDDFLSRLSSRAEVSSSVSKSSSSSGNSNAPQIGASTSMEPLQLFNNSPTGSMAASSLSAAKSSQDVTAEPTSLTDLPSNKGEPEVPDSQEPSNDVNKDIDTDNTHSDHQQKPDESDTYTQDENETNTDIVSRLSYRPDLLEAWVSNQSDPHQEDGDFSAGPSTHSNSHSEAFPSTGPTSISNNNRSSIDEDILSLTSISMKDEYFLVDGKTSHMYPGGGDNCAKVERSVASDGSYHRFDRSPSSRSQLACEIVGPGGPPIQRRIERSGGILRENSDSSTDEYLVTYSMWQRYCPD